MMSNQTAFAVIQQISNVFETAKAHNLLGVLLTWCRGGAEHLLDVVRASFSERFGNFRSKHTCARRRTLGHRERSYVYALYYFAQCQW